MSNTVTIKPGTKVSASMPKPSYRDKMKALVAKSKSKMEEATKVDNKLFFATINTGDKWELAGGVIIVSAKDKKEALKIAKIQSKGHTIELSDLTEIKPGKKNRVLFYQDPVIE